MTEDQVNIEVVMARRFELVEEMSIIEGRHKAELAPMAEELSLCEKFIHAEMLTSGAQQWKSANTGHMTFFTTQDSVKVGDPDQFFAYVFENKAAHLLNNAANKTSVKEYIEANNAPPPGVSYEARKVLAWRRGKA